ncbi:helix-turn-helix domain-containing protein [Curtobacterium sp. MCSS17_015]|uniref:helix-turn-helix domain-containing protein n=1 Tax=Curtobacterium sp. MCSS17_015 TaxID=2175666 RepID=UPI000DA9C653|nr:helix-turn-helix domain-containing protein [Curtobacterium sp. MCSS17_015]WIB25405.1 helix-turn-helix domain-containing protein [Curtobacterium sp. MCSS17_015]
MKTAPAGTGRHLKALREQSGVSQPLVAAMAGTSTAYLAKVEDGLFDPTRSYVGKVTEAVCRLMKDPPRPCAVLGCDNTRHIDGMDGRTGTPGLHHADEKRGNGWIVSVERVDDQDDEWSVYAEVSDDMALAAADFLAFTAAYQEASAYAAVLNRKPTTVTT